MDSKWTKNGPVFVLQCSGQNVITEIAPEACVQHGLAINFLGIEDREMILAWTDAGLIFDLGIDLSEKINGRVDVVAANASKQRQTGSFANGKALWGEKSDFKSSVLRTGV